MADEMINSYVALDLETTGIGARHEKITEIARDLNAAMAAPLGL